MAVTVTPLADACGAQISGIDMRQKPSLKDVEQIYEAWLKHLVIVIRDQSGISPADQKMFCGNFGKIGEYNRPKERQHPKYASDEIMLVSNVREDGRVIGAHPDGEMMWHTDTPYLSNPHKATTLYGVEIPKVGGNTLFSNQYMVYNALPATLRERLAGAKAMNAYEYGTTIKTFESYDRAAVPHHAHPVFRKHPETGRAAVYVCPLMTEEIIGLDSAESKSILAKIFAIQCLDKFVYEHVWRAGDLVMWDNFTCQHARTYFDPNKTRILRRVAVAGSRPKEYGGT